MPWKLADWICGGFKAERLDGEKVFIYRRLDWTPGRYRRSYGAFEFRWRGMCAGRLSTDGSWLRRARLLYTLDDPRTINEVDLLEIAGLLAKALN